MFDLRTAGGTITLASNVTGSLGFYFEIHFLYRCYRICSLKLSAVRVKPRVFPDKWIDGRQASIFLDFLGLLEVAVWKNYHEVDDYFNDGYFNASSNLDLLP